ncbi:MAG: carboxypeptidase-like regulatory domain-containing protein [Acidobacteria bacterium]|nr:carboxypeptidase-like regulatory domain-containing protein [Acidobacteriota bacterium]
MKRAMFILPLAAALVLLLAGVAFAQFETATVLGTVQDPSGAVVPQSKITLENTKTGISVTAVTDAVGNYEFLNVRSGSYRIKAEAAGFKTALAQEFTVAVNARQRVDLRLEVGDTTQTIEVTGAAAVLETDSSDRAS